MNTGHTGAFLTHSVRSSPRVPRCWTSYLADGLWFGDLGSVLVGGQGVEHKQQPLQLLLHLLLQPAGRHLLPPQDLQHLQHTRLTQTQPIHIDVI